MKTTTHMIMLGGIERSQFTNTLSKEDLLLISSHFPSPLSPIPFIYSLSLSLTLHHQHPHLNLV